jgi:hypothetical protein
MISEPEVCPDREQHTAEPNGYVAWQRWVKAMAKTHEHARCPTCGFRCIWVPKKKPTPPSGGGE